MHACRTRAQEYACNADANEAGKCLMELNVPHYHHELVKRCLVAAFEAETGAPGGGDRLLGLLRSLEGTGEVSQTQMRVGFDRVGRSLDDICLDVPAARGLYARYRVAALEQGWLAEQDDGLERDGSRQDQSAA